MAISLAVDDEVEAQLPPGGASFLDAVADELHPEEVHAVLLFGSVTSGEATAVSDVDLLVVLDGVSGERCDTLARRCQRLGAEHLPASDPPGVIERTVEAATGMFRSGFVTTRSAVEDGRFATVFDTSRLAYLLAPWRTTLASALEEAVVIYGSPVTVEWARVGAPLERSTREVLRSLLTSGSLALAQVGYALVSPRSVRYSLEAYKWSLYACGYHLHGAPVRLADRGTLFAGPPWRRYDERFAALREDPRGDLAFVLLTPLAVLAVHVVTLWRLFVDWVTAG